jgi:hypothetical protein
MIPAIADADPATAASIVHARRWLVVASLYISGAFLVFCGLAPALGFPAVAPAAARPGGGDGSMSNGRASPTSRAPDASRRIVLESPRLAVLRTTGRATTCVVDGKPHACRVGDVDEVRIVLRPPLAFSGELAFANVTTSEAHELEAVDAIPAEQLEWLDPFVTFVPIAQVRHGDAIAAKLRALVASHTASRCEEGFDGDRDHCRYFVNAALERPDTPRMLDGIADCAISTIDAAEGPPFSCQLVLVVDDHRRVWLRALAGFSQSGGRSADAKLAREWPSIQLFLPRAVAMASAIVAARQAGRTPTHAEQQIIDAYKRDERVAILRAGAAVQNALAAAPLRLRVRARSFGSEIWMFGIDPGNPSKVFADRLRTNADVRVVVRSSFCDSIAIAWPRGTEADEYCVGLSVDSILTVSHRNTDRDEDWRRPSRREEKTYDAAILDILRRTLGQAFPECIWATASDGDLVCPAPVANKPTPEDNIKPVDGRATP